MTPEQLGHVPARGWDDVLPVRAAVVARKLVQETRQMRTEVCACGGVIRANRFAPAHDVRAHYGSKRHAAWWATCGWAS